MDPGMNIALLIALALVVIVLVYLLVRLEGPSKSQWKSIARTKLGSIDRKSSGATTDGLKVILVEIDSLLDYCLKQKGMRGDTMGDRIKSSKLLFSREEYDWIWKAHKLRNRIVHEVDFYPSPAQLREEFNVLRSVVRKLVG
jgi:hypothetical protein